jgi:hypothetical protein
MTTYEKNSGELVKSCRRVIEILETGAQRADHTGLKRYLPKSPWVREIAYKTGVLKEDSAVYLTTQERQELAYHYRKLKGPLRNADKNERPNLLQQIISAAYEKAKGRK